MFSLKLFAVLVASGCSVTALDLPDYIKPCPRDSADVNTCIKNNLNHLLPKFSDEGEPRLNLERLDPLFLPTGIMVEYDNVGFTGNFSGLNNTSFGLKDAKVTNVGSSLSDPNNVRLEIDMEIPHILAKGAYLAVGAVAGIPVKGRGFYNVTLRDLNAEWRLRGKLIQKDGEEYLEIQQFLINPDTKFLKLYLSNFFTGSRTLDEALLSFVNGHWKPIYKRMVPTLEYGWANTMKGLANKVFLNIPFKQIFPKSS